MTSFDTIPRHAWTGGDTPTPQDRQGRMFRALRRRFFREYVGECGGLDLWKCAGTGSIERARILWNRADLDAWRTLTHYNAHAAKDETVWTVSRKTGRQHRWVVLTPTRGFDQLTLARNIDTGTQRDLKAGEWKRNPADL